MIELCVQPFPVTLARVRLYALFVRGRLRSAIGENRYFEGKRKSAILKIKD